MVTYQSDLGVDMNSLVSYIAEHAREAEANPWNVQFNVRRGLVGNPASLSPRKSIGLVMEFPDMYGSDVIVSHSEGEYEASSFTSGEMLSGFIQRYGASLVFPGFQHRSVPYKFLCTDVETETGLGAFATVFCTPKGRPGLHTHWDMGAVIVLQLEGEKHWKLGPPVVATLEELRSPRRVTAAEEAATPFSEVTLRAGDGLFVPRGWLHSAECRDDASVHVSIGIIHQDMQHLKLRAY